MTAAECFVVAALWAIAHNADQRRGLKLAELLCCFGFAVAGCVKLVQP